MANNRNKKVQKLRNYRDKLLAKITGVESEVRCNKETFLLIRKALQKDDTMRAFALASDGAPTDAGFSEFFKADEMAKELALIYRMLNVERRYSAEIQVAAGQRDYLRVAALSAQHQAESIAHDKMLSSWSEDHGFTRSLRKEMEDEGVI